MNWGILKTKQKKLVSSMHWAVLCSVQGNNTVLKLICISVKIVLDGVTTMGSAASDADLI